MKDRKLATRYARALLAALPDATSAEIADEFLAALAKAMESSSDLRNVLLNPAVPRSARKAVLKGLAEKHRVPEQVRMFLCVVADNRRTGHLPTIAQVFSEVREEEAGVVPVELEAARPLSPDLVEKARATLERVTGRKVRMMVEVRPGLIGGAVARVGSKVYDGSLRTQLEILRQRMAAE